MTLDRPPHVLVVAYNFPPHAAIGTMRTLRLVRYLAERGWSIEVLTSDPRTFRASTPVDDALLSRVPPQVRVVRAASWRWLDGRTTASPGGATGDTGPRVGTPSGTAQDRRSSFARLRRTLGAARAIPDRENAWLAPSVLAGLRKCRRPDVLYSSAPPWTGQLTALALSHRWGCPWVADFRDPWARAPWREDRPPFAARAAARLERRVIGRANAVVFTTQGNRDEFAGYYGPAAAARFAIVPNGCDVTEFDGLTPAPDEGKFVLLHPGSLYGGKRDPAPLFSAIASAVARGALDRERFRVRFLGPDAPEHVAALGRAHGLDRMLEIPPRVGRRESLQQMISASALLIIQPGHGVSVPGKLYEYLAARRPVLAMTDDDEIVNLVQCSGTGVATDPRDAVQIETALLAVVRMAEQRAFTPAPRALYDGYVQAAAVTRVFERVMNGTLPVRRGGSSQSGRNHE